MDGQDRNERGGARLAAMGARELNRVLHPGMMYKSICNVCRYLRAAGV
jgi:hypothetical protein